MLRAMTRGSGGVKSKIFLVSSYCREAKRVDHQRQFKGHEEKISSRNDSDSEETGSGRPSWRCNWVPHPRTGIYAPEGHEEVLDDVPKEAASLNPTFWLRNVDGVLEKPDPDTPPDHYYQYMHM